LIDLDELFICHLVVWVIFWVVFDRQPPIGFLDLVESGIPGHLKHVIEVPAPIRVILLKELLFALGLYSVSLVKFIEIGGCIIDVVLLTEQLIVVRPLVLIGKCFVCFRDIMKTRLSSMPVFLMGVGVPQG
jgi:hypothetical protein